MLTLEAALPETHVLLDGAGHTWIPEAVVLAEEVLRRCSDECLHLRELAIELTPAEGAAAARVEQQLKDDIDQLLQRVEPQLRTLETRLNGTEKASSEPAPNRAQRRAAERSKAKRGASASNGVRA